MTYFNQIPISSQIPQQFHLYDKSIVLYSEQQQKNVSKDGINDNNVDLFYFSLI